MPSGLNNHTFSGEVAHPSPHPSPAWRGTPPHCTSFPSAPSAPRSIGDTPQKRKSCLRHWGHNELMYGNSVYLMTVNIGAQSNGSDSRHRLTVIGYTVSWRGRIMFYNKQGRRSLWDRGDMSPNIYEGEASMVMSPQYFRSDIV